MVVAPKNILMLVGSKPIDDVGRVIAQAGICSFGSDGKPRVGLIYFDSADAERMFTDGRMYSVILHEMGHALGLGTVWGSRGLVSGSFGYTGVRGNEGLAMLGGSGQARVEDTGGQGTMGAHWKESVYIDELMTGWAQPAPQLMPLSKLTIKALEDLGFVVDVGRADSYTLPSLGRRLRKAVAPSDEILGCEVLKLDFSLVETNEKKNPRTRKARG